jgi:hypothetical protein
LVIQAAFCCYGCFLESASLGEKDEPPQVPLRTKIECPACHYDLVVKRGGKCPNCGAAISAHVTRVRARERRIEQVVAIIGSLLVLALFLATTGISLGLIEGAAVYALVGAAMFYLARKTFS